MYYSYDEALKIIENFMIETSIREFCQKMCMGACCRNCELFDDCSTIERRMYCSISLCDNLLHILYEINLLYIWNEVNKALDNAFSKTKSHETNKFHARINVKSKRVFKIKKEILSPLTDSDNIKFFKSKMSAIWLLCSQMIKNELRSQGGDVDKFFERTWT